ncbi:hypothetical protein [Spirosoma pomorum]
MKNLLALNLLASGQHLLALTWLHWLHVSTVGAFLFYLIKGFNMLRPSKSWPYRVLEWGVVLSLSAYLAALVTNAPESKTSVQDLIEPWIFLTLAIGAGYSVSKWPGIVQEAIEQQLTPERDYWRLAPHAGGLLIAGLFSLGLLSSGIDDVKQGQQQVIATDATAAREAMAARKENARLRAINEQQSAKQDTLIDLVAQVLIVAQSNGLTAQMSVEEGKKREALITNLARQLKRYQQIKYQRSVTTPEKLPALPYQTSQVVDPDSTKVDVLFVPDLAVMPD